MTATPTGDPTDAALAQLRTRIDHTMRDTTAAAATGSPQRAQGPAGAVIHIAGFDVQINHLLRQRCAWCSTILLDYDLDRMAVPVGTDPRPAIWPVGALVAVDGGLSYVVDHAAGDPLPDGMCTADRPSVAAAGSTGTGGGDGQAPAPADAQRAAGAVIDAWRRAGYTSDTPAPLAEIAEAAVKAAYPLIAAAVLLDYANQHHAYPGGPTDLVSEIPAGRDTGDETRLVCRGCGRWLQDGACTGERPRLVAAAGVSRRGSRTRSYGRPTVAERAWEDLRSSGLLWLINRVVFHPRGYALAIQYRNGQAVGWLLLGDGEGPWQMEGSEQGEFARAEATLKGIGSPPPEEADRG